MSKSADQIRAEFISFFKERGHTYIHSSPVVPTDDPTLLFTNAGMNQFKSIFLGDSEPGVARAVNSQKCMRVSGKHNDLEEVGKDHTHHTFFEMLGNWSFGDYYKKEAIEWAWELLTGVWKLPKHTLYATVYTEDDEAARLWQSQTDVDPSHIQRFGTHENFWQMGDTGPCGPCSEIHMDIGEDACALRNDPGHTCAVNAPGCGRYIEIWNLVFIQYNLETDGTCTRLKHTHVDTGMGLERICAILQQVPSNYDIDVLRPIIDEVCRMSGASYAHGREGIPMRVIADHIRALVFSITDGVFPSNEGRGYVIRRILRRAFRFGRQIGLRKPFLYTLVDTVVSRMGQAYPEITKRVDYVKGVIRAEEERFADTLEQGIEKLSTMIAQAKQHPQPRLSGEDVFVLYDTYGFPMDLTRLMAQEEDVGIDEQGFAHYMSAQKERSRAATGVQQSQEGVRQWVTIHEDSSATTFVGYDSDTCQARVRSYAEMDAGESDRYQYLLVLDKTPFYARAGGQLGDTGQLELANGSVVEVVDTYKMHDSTVHRIQTDTALDPQLLQQPVHARIDTARRNAIRRNHSVTHLLHAALRTFLGAHVQQSGSRVAPDEMRFDYTHFEAVSSEDIVRIERQVNEWILANAPVRASRMSYKEAIGSGIIALFGEKYGDEVRVIEMGEVSRELCGGTHVHATGDIGLFHITGESSIAAGIRRITAITGMRSLDYLHEVETGLSRVAALVKTDTARVYTKIEALLEKEAALRTQNEQLLQARLQNSADTVLSDMREKDGLRYTVRNMGEKDKKEFTTLVNAINDALKNEQEPKVVLLGAAGTNGAQFAATASPAALTRYKVHCGDIVKTVARQAGGGGGGRPDRAQAGGKRTDNMDEALQAGEDTIVAYV
jgi:alanyl-tRNA synthetase